jgi:hypothetical protein
MKKLIVLLLIAFPVIAQQEANRFTIIPNTNGSAQGALLFQGLTRSVQANVDSPSVGVVEFGDGTVGHANAQLKIGSLLSSGAISGLSFSGAGTGLTGTAASLSIGGNAATATNATQLNGLAGSSYLDTTSGSQTKTGSLTFGGVSVVNESGNTNYGWSLTLQQPSSSGTDGPGLGWSKALASGSTQYWRWGIDHGTNIGSISLSEGINFGTDRITVAPGGAVTVAGTLASADGLASVLQWSGCDRTGASDSTSCFNAALSATAGKGLRIPSGTYLVGQLNIPSNIRVVGDGPASKLVRNASIASGYGWLDVANQSNVKLENFMLEGQVTSSTGFDRASLTTPVTSTFTANTSIWIHGGTNIDLNRLLIQHTGGYSVFIDARSANVENVRITENTLQDNRPFLFGSGSDLTYGSWLGGIFYASDGANYSIQNLSITDNTLKRVSGNGIWGWAASTSLLNSGITISRNHFQYMGLDGIEPGPVEALTVHDNTAQYIGFVSTSDGAPGSPKWFNGFTSVPAVAFDSSGLMRNVSFVGNVAIWVNGGCFDLDGASYGVYANNRCYNPQWFDSGYNSTTASQMGPNGLGGQNYMYGMNTGNTNQTSQGASDLEITGNSIYGFGGGSYRLYAARNVHLVGNKAVAVDNSNSTTAHNFYLPITLGNTGTGANQRAQNNTVTKNKITYPSYSGQAGIFAVGEDSRYGAFQSGDTNTVYDNDLVGALGVFTKDINSSTVSFGMGLISGSGLSTSTYSWCNALSGSTAINCITSQAQTSSGHTSLNFYDGSTWLASIADTGALTAVTGSFTSGLSASVMTIGSGSSSVSGSLGVSGPMSMGGQSTVNEAGNVNYGWSLTLNESTATSYDGPHLGFAKNLSSGGTQYWTFGVDHGGTVGSLSINEGSSYGTARLTIAQGGAVTIPQSLTVSGALNVGSLSLTGGMSATAITIGSGASFMGGSLGVGGALSANSLSITNGIGANVITIGSGASSITGSLGVGGALSSNSLTVTNGIGANVISIGGGASSISGSLGVGGALSAASLSLGPSSSLGVGTGGISTTGSIFASGNGIYVNGIQTENSSRQFVGAGVYTPSYGITGGSFSLPGFTVIDGSGNFSSTGYVNASNFKSNGSAGVTKTLTGTFTCGGVTVGNIVFNNGILINCY